MDFCLKRNIWACCMSLSSPYALREVHIGFPKDLNKSQYSIWNSEIYIYSEISWDIMGMISTPNISWQLSHTGFPMDRSMDVPYIAAGFHSPVLLWARAKKGSGAPRDTEATRNPRVTGPRLTLANVSWRAANGRVSECVHIISFYGVEVQKVCTWIRNVGNVWKKYEIIWNHIISTYVLRSFDTLCQITSRIFSDGLETPQDSHLLPSGCHGIQDSVVLHQVGLQQPPSISRYLPGPAVPLQT